MGHLHKEQSTLAGVSSIVEGPSIWQRMLRIVTLLEEDAAH